MAESLRGKRRNPIHLTVPNVAPSMALNRKLFGATPHDDFHSEEEVPKDPRRMTP